MLWGDLRTIIVSSKEQLSENIIKAIEKETPTALGSILSARRLTGWANSTTIDELEDEDMFYSTEALLKQFDKWQD